MKSRFLWTASLLFGRVVIERHVGYKVRQEIDICSRHSPKVGTTILGRKTYPMSDFFHMAQDNNVKFAILTVPATVAQELTDMMVEAGIQAIWNFAPVQLAAPPDVIVENVSLSSSLAVLSQRFTVQSKKEAEAPQS